METYDQAISYLFERLPMFQRQGGLAMKKGLDNILALCEALGNPHQQFHSIHIGGTNGKGSTAHLISAILQSAGYRTGLYTSPHYRDFRERVKLNGQLVPKEFVLRFVRENQGLFERIRPSYFEMTVAMAFAFFAEKEVEAAVVEVGLGGRLDSTNILQPDLCVITNISFDHMEYLGNTLEAIAGEKAGIIKPGIPVVIGETQAETKQVFKEKARTEGAPIYFADRDWEVIPLETDPEFTYFQVRHYGKVHWECLAANVHGDYQSRNLQTVLEAVHRLPETWKVTKSDIGKGLKKVRELTNFIGRWQLLQHNPKVLADSAHNEGGLRYLQRQLQELEYEHLHMVFGMVADKERGKVFPLLPREATYYFAKPDIPRGLDAELLATEAHSAGLRGRAYASVSAALEAAKTAAGVNDLIFVGGSIFVVAEVV